MSQDNKSATEIPDDEDFDLSPEVKLRHTFNYVGGPYAFKNSSKRGVILDPENLKETILMVGYGKARPVQIAVPKQDPRAGVFPQHNTPDDFKDTLELIPSKSLDAYLPLVDTSSLEENGYTHFVASMTKERIKKISKQFAHLSQYAFNQMMDITVPDKRDFDIWYKTSPENKQVLIAYPNKKTGLTILSQVLQYNDDKEIVGIRHCTFDQGKPLVVNETYIDQFVNLRQIAHLGVRNKSRALNSVERFDDGTIIWTITKDKITGSAALKLSGEIVIVNNQLNESSELAARNLGGELLIDGKWSGMFSLEALQPSKEAKREEFKEKTRKQVSQIIDGATIPGLDPIFKVPY